MTQHAHIPRYHDRFELAEMEPVSVTQVRGKTNADPVSPQPQKQRVTVFLPTSLIERLRNAVYWTEYRTLAQIITDAVDGAVTEMEHANGGAFPPRLAPLKPGRPRHRPSLIDSPSQK